MEIISIENHQKPLNLKLKNKFELISTLKKSRIFLLHGLVTL